MLYLQAAVEYRELKEILDIGDGKLAGHLKSLVENKPPLIKVEKMSYEPNQVIDRTRSKYTVYVLTKEGRELFQRFSGLLKNIIEDDDGNE